MFANVIKRCEETERKIALIEAECKRYKITLHKPKSVENFLDTIGKMRRVKKKAANVFFEEVERDITDKDRFVSEQSKKLRMMHENYSQLIEYKSVLGKAAEMIRGPGRGSIHIKNPQGDKGGEGKQPLLDEDMMNEISIAHVAGTIDIKD